MTRVPIDADAVLTTHSGMQHAIDAEIVLSKYDERDAAHRMSDEGQALLREARTRALVSIARSLAESTTRPPFDNDTSLF